MVWWRARPRARPPLLLMAYRKESFGAPSCFSRDYDGSRYLFQLSSLPP